MWDFLLPSTTGPSGDSLARLLYSLLIAFILGQLNAWCYKWTHRGLSYSPAFTHSLVLIAVLGAFSMSLIGSNVVYAFGLLGALAIVRFRTILRDSRDSVYLLMSLLCGMAAGFGYYAGAIGGVVVANAIGLYLTWTDFGSIHALDSLLRFQIRGDGDHRQALDAVLRQYCRRISVISVDEAPDVGLPGGPAFQFVYKVRLRDPQRGPELIDALRGSLDIQAVHLLVHQEGEEIA